MSSTTRRQRIRYVLPLAQDEPGHRLGVNGLAFDQHRSILYSGGKDGIVFAWDASRSAAETGALGDARPPHYLTSVQAHSHWINDMVLAQGGEALVTASSDTSVKLWRPHAADLQLPVNLGSHNDYVKCVTCPKSKPPWVASAGLDRNIAVWDLHGAGQVVRFPVFEEPSEKGSIYALASTQSVVASGGPDSIVRLHDTRSGRRISQFIGHTDNIRSLLISESHDIVISSSSDRAVKIWSITAGRCLSSLALHADSVWSLYSDDPSLAVFYSGDRAGIVAKTDCRAISGGGIDQAVSFALCQENEGINRMIAANGRVWTATASSNLNIWRDLDHVPGTFSIDTPASPRRDTVSRHRPSISINGTAGDTRRVPINCVLRFPNMFSHQTSTKHRSRLSTYHSIAAKKGSTAAEAEFGAFAPLRARPESVIEGKAGIVKHILLNDKQRILTLDTAGEVLLWDIIQCRVLQAFGKVDLDQVVQRVNTKDVILSWCSIDTNTGAVSCTLEEKGVFDGEVYADCLEQAKGYGFAEDHRMNLGAWALRSLFDAFVREERSQDDAFRRDCREQSAISPTQLRIDLPPPSLVVDESIQAPASQSTPRAQHPQTNTPGLLAIGAATPFLAASGAASTGKPTEQIGSSHSVISAKDDSSQARKSGERAVDYFSAKPIEESTDTSSEASQKQTATPEGASEASRSGQNKDATAATAAPTKLSQRFRNTFSGKRSGKQATSPGLSKSMQQGEKSDEADPVPHVSNGENAALDRRTAHVLQEMRQEYVQKAKGADSADIESLMRLCVPEETLPILLPPSLTVLIQQEVQPESSLATVDLFQGRQRDLGKHAAQLEQAAPYWLGAFLFKNERPAREPSKYPFVLKSMDETLPQVTANDGAERLNANRIIRMRKALEYVAERLQPIDDTEATERLRPDECLEMYCQDQLLPLNMSLAQVKAHVWKTSGDVVLYYKSTGRRKYDAHKVAEPASQRPPTATA